MAEGVPGSGVTVTEAVRAGEIPQAFVAVTLMVPDVVPGVAMMVLLLLLPAHPAGSVQV